MVLLRDMAEAAAVRTGHTEENFLINPEADSMVPYKVVMSEVTMDNSEAVIRTGNVVASSW